MLKVILGFLKYIILSIKLELVSSICLIQIFEKDREIYYNYIVAHYSSQSIYYEDEIKQSLKGTSVKPLVFASYAQFGVDAEGLECWALVMAYDKRPTTCGDPYLW